MTTTQIEKLANRYPFVESELEQLLRCHATILNKASGEEPPPTSFLMKLAMSSSSSDFFLVFEERKKRVKMVLEKVLPSWFEGRLEGAITKDCFVDVANEGDEKHLEKFLEGLADTGRRGPREALRVLFDCCQKNGGSDGKVEASEMVHLCYRLFLAAELLVALPTNVEALMPREENEDKELSPLVESLLKDQDDPTLVSKAHFLDWGDEVVPMIASTLSTFMHNILFPGKPFPMSRTPFKKPEMYESSDLFPSSHSPLLFALACMSPQIGGKWSRLYSYSGDGQSFNRLQFALLGYSGPTLLLVGVRDGNSGTTPKIGAYTNATWKESSQFFGSSDGFLFQLEPCLQVFHATGAESNFMYCNPSTRTRGKPTALVANGIGFGGDREHPRLHIKENMEKCRASTMDKTYKAGPFLPEQFWETFNVEDLEVWAVGGDDVIHKALEDRATSRDVHDAVLMQARTVQDRKPFLEDFESGMIESKIYAHRKEARGRADFAVDDKHGGYKIDPEESAKRLEVDGLNFESPHNV